ncbi:sugar carrier protein A [Artemisia annua]|uniref:Sugar carrier protein A n=1 Tax=Artemisia annua TaxID=35608 RepID=A0A2U1LWY5_ARTAN|nr:sugar carrier protein A [Artemisia annua]
MALSSCYASQILTGLNSFLFYDPVLFQSLGFKRNASLYSSALTGAVLCLSTFVSIAAVDKLDRKVLLIGGDIQMIICKNSQKPILSWWLLSFVYLSQHLGGHGAYWVGQCKARYSRHSIIVSSLPQNKFLYRHIQSGLAGSILQQVPVFTHKNSLGQKINRLKTFELKEYVDDTKDYGKQLLECGCHGLAITKCIVGSSWSRIVYSTANAIEAGSHFV